MLRYITLLTRRQVLLFLTVSISSLLVACAMAPTQEMSDARQAVQAAREAGAQTHAQSALTEAEKLLLTAEENLGRKTYREARGNAVAAKTQAITARQLALAISSAKETISHAMKLGVTSPAAASLLDQALAFAKRGDHENALDSAHRAKIQIDRDIAKAGSKNQP